MLNPDRLLPSLQLIRQQLDAGKLGEIGLVRVQRWEPPSSTAARKGLPPSLWRDLDVTLWLVGQSPTNVFAAEPQPAESELTNGRTVQIHLGFASGAMALIGYSDQLPAGDAYQSWTVISSAGAAYFDGHDNRQLAFRGGNAQTVRADESDEQHAALVRDCDDWLLANAASLAKVPDWHGTSRVVEAVLRSLVTRQAIDFAEEGR